MLRFEINELALVVEILVEHGKCLRLGRLRQLRSDMAPQALDALFERLLANGAEEVVEQLAQLWTDDQVAGGVQLELAVDLGALAAPVAVRWAGRAAVRLAAGDDVGASATGVTVDSGRAIKKPRPSAMASGNRRMDLLMDSPFGSGRDR